MSDGRRWWALSRAQTLVAVALAIAGGVGIALVTWPSPTGGDGAALWAFGFETVRVDADDLGDGRTLDVVAFGDVLGTGDEVLMFEGGTGAVGRLDAGDGRMTTLTTVDSVSTPAAPSKLAFDGHALWLVTGPGELTELDAASGATEGTHEVHGGAPVTGSTAVVADGDRIVAVVEVAGGTRVTVVGGASTVLSAAEVGGPLTGLAAGGGTTWLVSARRAVAVDGEGQVTRTLELPALGVADARVAALSAGALWTIVDGGTRLVAIDARTGTPRHGVTLLDTPPARPRTGLVAHAGAVFAMTSRGDDPAGRPVRIVRVDAASGRASTALDLPAELFVGEIAVTG